MPKYNVVVESKTRYVVEANGDDLYDALSNYHDGHYDLAEAATKANPSKLSTFTDVVMVYVLTDNGPVVAD